jgi:hypothetical protein
MMGFKSSINPEKRKSVSHNAPIHCLANYFNTHFSDCICIQTDSYGIIAPNRRMGLFGEKGLFARANQ